MKILLAASWFVVCPSLGQTELLQQAVTLGNAASFQMQPFGASCKTMSIGTEYEIKERPAADIIKIGYWPSDRVDRDDNGKVIYRGREEEGYALTKQIDPPQPKPVVDEKKLEEQRRKNRELARKWGLPAAVFVIEE